MVAGGKRAVAKHIATPIDLNGRYAASAAAYENSAGFWGEMPWEFQVFRHVPLQMDGMICLWGAGNAKAGNVYPEEVVGIPVNQKFDTLYVYHCTFYASPKDTPVYDLVFRYEDGESATNTIRYGVDTMDFNTSGGRALKGPSGPQHQSGLGRLVVHGGRKASVALQPDRHQESAGVRPGHFHRLVFQQEPECRHHFWHDGRARRTDEVKTRPVRVTILN